MALWTASFVMFFMTYCFGVVLVTGFAYYQRLRDAEVRNSSLEQGWTNARLAALRMQLSPHTLFNLLHTIRGHINKEPQVARAMVVQLADLLRRLLSASQREFVSLPEELTFVRLYLELQQQRFAERLTIVLPLDRKPFGSLGPELDTTAAGGKCRRSRACRPRGRGAGASRDGRSRWLGDIARGQHHREGVHSRPQRHRSE